MSAAKQKDEALVGVLLQIKHAHDLSEEQREVIDWGLSVAGYTGPPPARPGIIVRDVGNGKVKWNTGAHLVEISECFVAHDSPKGLHPAPGAAAYYSVKCCYHKPTPADLLEENGPWIFEHETLADYLRELEFKPTEAKVAAFCVLSMAAGITGESIRTLPDPGDLDWDEDGIAEEKPGKKKVFRWLVFCPRGLVVTENLYQWCAANYQDVMSELNPDLTDPLYRFWHLKKFYKKLVISTPDEPVFGGYYVRRAYGAAELEELQKEIG